MKKTLLFIILLFIVMCVPLADLFHSGLPITHDGPDHVARIANFYQSFLEGHMMPRWAENLNWGYGHPILMFLYPFSSYAATFFHTMGFSLVDSTKVVFGVAYAASVLAFFLWATKQWGVTAGLVGATLYGLAPYRFVDLYVRGALGEHVAFIFPPIIFLGLLGIARGSKRWPQIATTLGVAGLILSHNAISLMVLPVVLVYACYLYVFESKNKNIFIIQSILFVGFGFLISAFFWIPAFFEGKYTLRDIVTKGVFVNRFVSWSQFFSMPWSFGGTDELSKEIGVIQWIVIAVSLVSTYFIKKTKYRMFIYGSFAIFFVSLVIMTNWSSLLWQRVMILQNFQFPWRFLTVSVLMASMIGSAFASYWSKKYSSLIVLLVVAVGVITTYGMWHAIKYDTTKPESYYSGIYDSTTDTGESSPVWSIRFMEHRWIAPELVVEGKGDITARKRDSTLHDYTVNASEKSRILENTLYFPGWRVIVDGQEVPIQFQDPTYRGLMTFWVDPGVHQVSVQFTNTKLRNFANAVSFIGLLFMASLSLLPLWKNKK